MGSGDLGITHSAERQPAGIWCPGSEVNPFRIGVRRAHARHNVGFDFSAKCMAGGSRRKQGGSDAEANNYSLSPSTVAYILNYATYVQTYAKYVRTYLTMCDTCLLQAFSDHQRSRGGFLS